MRLQDFDFDLPEELIALRPARPRSSARLLEVPADTKETFLDRHISDLPNILRSGDRLVVNDTKVLPSRLRGIRIRGDLRASVEVTLTSALSGGNRWLALIKPGRRVSVGDDIAFPRSLCAKVEDKSADGGFTMRFDMPQQDFLRIIELIGHMPLPPYIGKKRAVDKEDQADYQSWFANKSGALAAPTASLHFDERLLDRIAAKGVELTKITLHVGAGTFAPIRAENIENHHMHSEWGQISEDAAADIRQTRERGGRIIAVGTTCLRLLESSADERGDVRAFCGNTNIFIRPGSKINTVDALLTNFHLPCSTLYILVSAFSGSAHIRAAYRWAIEKKYRFFSYGDACLLWRR